MIEKYKSKIQGLEKDLKEILKQESEEKEVGEKQVAVFSRTTII